VSEASSVKRLAVFGKKNRIQHRCRTACSECSRLAREFVRICMRPQPGAHRDPRVDVARFDRTYLHQR